MIKEKYLYDKVKKIEAIYYFQDNYGRFFVDTDPNGLDMSGKISIAPISHFPEKYEIMERDKSPF